MIVVEGNGVDSGLTGATHYTYYASEEDMGYNDWYGNNSLPPGWGSSIKEAIEQRRLALSVYGNESWEAGTRDSSAVWRDVKIEELPRLSGITLDYVKGDLFTAASIDDGYIGGWGGPTEEEKAACHSLWLSVRSGWGVITEHGTELFTVVGLEPSPLSIEQKLSLYQTGMMVRSVLLDGEDPSAE
jgi:hypothetical protein